MATDDDLETMWSIKARKKCSHRKVRTGCRQCKARRLKCDEDKPGCRRCLLKGIECEYVPLKPWIFESANPLSKSDSQSASSKRSPIVGEQLFPVVSEREFQFFMELTAPLMGAYYAVEAIQTYQSPSEIDRVISTSYIFWTQVLPRVIQVQPEIKHAVLAISSLHEAIEMAPQPAWQNSSFTRNYTKALRLVTRADENIPIERVLISCLLFSMVDFFHGHPTIGVAHIFAGTKIIEEYERNPRVNKAILELIRDYIKPLFTLHARYAKMVMSPECIGDQTPDTDTGSRCEEIDPNSQPLRNIHDVRHALFNLSRMIMTDGFCDSSDSGVDRNIVKNRLRSFRMAYGNWKMGLDHPLSPGAERCRRLLDVHFRILTILASNRTHNEMGFDKFSQDLETILAETGNLISKASGSGEPQKVEEVAFQFNLGFIFPLFFVAVKCRRQPIRDQALELLRTVNVVEKMWNSCVAYGVAAKVRDLEETQNSTRDESHGGHYAVVPAEFRIRLLGVKSGPQPGTVTIQYHKPLLQNLSSTLIHSETLRATPCQWNRPQTPHISRAVRRCGYQGLLQPVAGQCSCGGFGVSPATFAQDDESDTPPRSSLILAGRLPLMSKCLAGWGVPGLNSSSVPIATS